MLQEYSMSDLINPYPTSSRWQRGNLHTHTTRSDGRDEPQAVIDWYEEHGYEFLVISDHNYVLPVGDIRLNEMLFVQGEELTHPRTHVVGIDLKETLPTTCVRGCVNSSPWTNSISFRRM